MGSPTIMFVLALFAIFFNTGGKNTHKNIYIFPKKDLNNSFDILVESIKCYECGWAKGDGGGDTCGAFDSSIETTCAGTKLE